MRQLCEARPEPRGSNVDAGLGRVLHLDVEAAVRGHGGVGLAVHALVVAPRPRPAELPRGWAQQGLVLVAVPESLEPVDMSEVRCAGSSRATSRWRPRWWVL